MTSRPRKLTAKEREREVERMAKRDADASFRKAVRCSKCRKPISKYSKGRVIEAHPEAYAWYYSVFDLYVIYPKPGLGFGHYIGEGETERRAWANAAKRLERR